MQFNPDSNDNGGTIVHFVLPTAQEMESRLSVEHVFHTGTRIKARYSLLPINRIREIDLGFSLIKSLRFAFNHLLNLTKSLEESEAQLRQASLEFETTYAGRSRQRNAPADAEFKKASRHLRFWTTSIDRETIRLAKEEKAFYELIATHMPELSGRTVFIRRGYRISELTLPQDLPWLDIIPEELRPLVAARLFKETSDPYQIKREEIESQLSDEPTDGCLAPTDGKIIPFFPLRK